MITSIIIFKAYILLWEKGFISDVKIGITISHTINRYNGYLIVKAEKRRLTETILITNRESTGFPFLELIMYAKKGSFDNILKPQIERIHANQKLPHNRLKLDISIQRYDSTLIMYDTISIMYIRLYFLSPKIAINEQQYLKS